MSYKITMGDFLKLVDQGMIVTEGKSWTEKGLKCRIDPPNGYAGKQRHIHVGKFAWNQDGSRSHEGCWGNSEPTNRARQIAARGGLELISICWKAIWIAWLS